MPENTRLAPAALDWETPSGTDRRPFVGRLPRWGLQLSERRVLLFIGDCAAAILAVVGALTLWTLTARVPTMFSSAYAQSRAYWWVLVPLWLVLNVGLYDLRTAASSRASLRNLSISLGVALGLYLVVYFSAPPSFLLRLVVFYFILLAFGCDLAWRLTYVAVFTSRNFRRRVLIVGAGWAGEAIATALRESAAGHYSLLGFIDDDSGKHGQAVAGVPVLGSHERLLEFSRLRQVTDIVLAITGEVRGEIYRELLRCQEHGIDIVRMPVLYEELMGRVPIEHLQVDWLITSLPDSVRLNSLLRVGKRLLDLIGAVGGLVVLVLVVPWVAVAIWLTSPGSVFYRQARVGRGGKLFTVFKFRTMEADAESDGLARWAEPSDSRVTPTGRFLRRTRLDELPQFVNVLSGDMSLVGPRPERPEFFATLEKQIPFYRARLLVKPGITGWAQINYGYGATVEEAALKLQYDLYYLKHQSLWLDLVILARTVAVSLGLKGR